MRAERGFRLPAQKLQCVAPPGGTVATALAERGSSQYTRQGGGPADGALYSAVIALQVSSTRAGHPSAAHRVAIVATVEVGDLMSSTVHDQIELVGGDAQHAPRVVGKVAPLARLPRRSRSRTHRPTQSTPTPVTSGLRQH
jgi:hypothetical protein